MMSPPPRPTRALNTVVAIRLSTASFDDVQQHTAFLPFPLPVYVCVPVCVSCLWLLQAPVDSKAPGALSGRPLAVTLRSPLKQVSSARQVALSPRKRLPTRLRLLTQRLEPVLRLAQLERIFSALHHFRDFIVDWADIDGPLMFDLAQRLVASLSVVATHNQVCVTVCGFRKL